MSDQVLAFIYFCIVFHIIISVGVWAVMNDPYRRNEWSYGKCFWWPLVVFKYILIGLYEVLFTGWKR